MDLGNLDVFAARSLRPLSSLEGDGLSLAEFVERRLTARRTVEEVLVSVRRQDEPETFIAHQPLDRTVRHLPWHTDQGAERENYREAEEVALGLAQYQGRSVWYEENPQSGRRTLVKSFRDSD
jgi:hypothetical protein